MGTTCLFVCSGSEKLGIGNMLDLRVVLANDGTEVDDDETLAAVNSEPLMLLTRRDVWFPEIVGAQVIATGDDTASQVLVIEDAGHHTEPSTSASAEM